jgi:hypothetical protein
MGTRDLLGTAVEANRDLSLDGKRILHRRMTAIIRNGFEFSKLVFMQENLACIVEFLSCSFKYLQFASMQTSVKCSRKKLESAMLKFYINFKVLITVNSQMTESYIF